MTGIGAAAGISAMKFIQLVLAGAADAPCKALDGKTPLEVARTPHLDRWARSGRLGTLAVAGNDDVAAASDTGLLQLLGYDPDTHRARRGVFEAMAAGVALEPGDLVLRANFVTLDGEVIADATAGRLSDGEARVLLADLARELEPEGFRFHALSRYRFLVVVKNGAMLDVDTAPPYATTGEPVRSMYPEGKDAHRFAVLLDRSRRLLAEHEVNRVRVDLGENPANFLWAWGQGADAALPDFATLHGKKGLAVAGSALARGVAQKAGFTVADVPGASGDLETDLTAKAQAVRAALPEHDFIFVHVQAPNEATHLRDPRRKVAVLEEIDAKLVRPLTDMVAALPQARVMVASDHVSPSETDRASPQPTPFVITGTDIAAVREWPFDEAHAAKSDLKVDRGAALLEFFLR
ncbi:MAG: 2,3-bisphosphoglycerate-independent phosphoglycerate mutase [Planctomycetes bacterium]|nr:2,3-bisphosphoglycerate-independent phosphoglycerate mutase [Planctomycetota bacterium]